MIQYYAYIYRNPITKLPFYVGKGCNDRAYQHLKGYTKIDNAHLYNVIQKMIREGIQPKIEIFNMPNEETALDLEMDLIRFYGRKDLEMGPLLNLTDGGESGYKMFGDDNPMRRPEVKAKFIGKKRPDFSKRLRENHHMKPGMTNSGSFKSGKDNFMFGKKQEIVTCPYCGKSGGKSGMIQWHFENCKDKL